MNLAENNSQAAEVWRLAVDGSSWPNPGRMGVGVVLTAPDGGEQTFSVPLGGHGCNNEAELRALYLGLETAKHAGALMLEVVSDSDFAIRHGRGEQATRKAGLQALIDQVRQLMADFVQVDLIWVPRHRNGQADDLARQALGLATKPALAPTGRRRK